MQLVWFPFTERIQSLFFFASVFLAYACTFFLYCTFIAMKASSSTFSHSMYLIYGKKHLSLSPSLNLESVKTSIAVHEPSFHFSFRNVLISCPAKLCWESVIFDVFLYAALLLLRQFYFLRRSISLFLYKCSGVIVECKKEKKDALALYLIWFFCLFK